MITQGDVVLVPFPFSDLSSTKVRPALVLAHYDNAEDFLICALTTQNISNALHINANDVLEGSLPKDSYVKYWKITTVHQNIIQKVVATLSGDLVSKVTQNICKLLKV